MRLLVVDNGNQLPESYVAGLWRAGFEGDRVRGVEKGEWMLKKNNYDLLIVGGGLEEEVYGFMKKSIEKSFKGFSLFVAEEISAEARSKFYDLGVDEIMSGPVSFREILAKIKIINSWEKKANLVDNCLRLADLLIDLRRFKVFRAGKEIRLRKKEFDLLYYLFINRGIVLDKMIILESVWDVNYLGSTNTLEVHMLNLRKKIDGGRPPKEKIIHTVNGRGYIFGLYDELANPLFWPMNPFYPKKRTSKLRLPAPVAY